MDTEYNFGLLRSGAEKEDCDMSMRIITNVHIAQHPVWDSCSVNSVRILILTAVPLA